MSLSERGKKQATPQRTASRPLDCRSLFFFFLNNSFNKTFNLLAGRVKAKDISSWRRSVLSLLITTLSLLLSSSSFSFRHREHRVW